MQVVVRFVGNVVLARLLTPKAFGVFALALVVVNLFSLLSGLGLGEALVQRRDLTPEHVETAFVTSAVVGLGMAVLVAGSAPLAAIVLGDRAVTVPLVALSARFLFAGVERTPNDMLVRELRFGAFYASSTIAAVVSIALGIGLAIQLRSVAALVAMTVAEAFLASALGWVFAVRAGVWRPRIGWHRDAFGQLASYGKWVAAGRFTDYVLGNVDNLTIGRVLGSRALGFYALAYRTMLAPVNKVANVMGAAAFPALAAVQDDRDRLGVAVRDATVYIALVCFPVTVGLALVADLVVPLLFGPQWLPAVPVVRLLAASGPFSCLSNLDSALCRAVGRPDLVFSVGLLGVAAFVPAFVIGVAWGIKGVAVGFLVAAVVTAPIPLLLRTRLLAVPLWSQVRPLLPVAAATLVMIAAVVAARRAFGLDRPTIASVALTVGIGAVAYLGSLLVASPSLVRHAITDLRRR